jgi:hypothetical protein
MIASARFAPAAPRATHGRWRLALLLAACAAMALVAARAPAAAFGLDRTARVLAGFELAEASELPVSPPLLERHAREANRWWNDYERRIGAPLRDWAAAEIPSLPGSSIFYPFSGPDFPTVQRLYPDADRYALVALQRGEPPPALERVPAAEANGFLERFGGAWRQFAQIGFFRTLDLDAEGSRPGLRVGVTAALMAFAARLGFEVVAVEPVRVNAYGTGLEAHPGDRADAATWDSVRLVLARGGRLVLLDYVRADLSDAALAAEPGVQAWIEMMAEQPTVLKAASHLLQQPGFSILRDAILARAPGVIQDETGIEYGQLAKVFNVTLHGRFTQPHHLFGEKAQRSLAAAYRSASGVKPLPFRMSYQRLDGANLQVAWRPAAQAPAPELRPSDAAGRQKRKRRLYLTRGAAEQRHAVYYDAVRSHVAGLLAARGISTGSPALVSLGLAPDGTLQGVQVEGHSGNAGFDQRLRELLRGARRFPAWPDSMRQDGDLAIVTLHVPEP